MSERITKTPVKTQRKKHKNKLSKSKRKKIWELYDSEIKEQTNSDSGKDTGKDTCKDTGQKSEKTETNKIECVYRSCGEREFCDLCNASVQLAENGFLTCSNKSCGIIYSDSLDSSAEWRFYGAEDSQNSDPTRCGMPINPLLKESSYGCKVVCGTT